MNQEAKVEARPNMVSGDDPLETPAHAPQTRIIIDWWPFRVAGTVL
jgi:hypothetical protein